jgi:hypothetical protein
MTPIVRSKPGCTFDRIAPAGFVLLAAIQDACFQLGIDLVITAGTNDHELPDPHGLGEAYDLSVANLNDAELARVLTRLRTQLPAESFTVLCEAPSLTGLSPARQELVTYVNAAATAVHIHLQRRKNVVYPPLPVGIRV